MEPLDDAQIAHRLDVSAMSCSYGRKDVVFEVDFHVRPGEVVALFGHNGAGKTTAIKNIFGVYTPSSGTITYDGEDITGAPPRSNVQRGMALIPSERFVFGDLPVRDNLLLGAGSSPDDEYLDRKFEEVYALFPILNERSKQLAGTMSGGQQRMVSLGLALMSSPQLLLLDEPSLGLAPAIVEEIFEAVRDLTEGGLSVLLLEQNVGQALKVADRSYVMRGGRIILEETTEQMLTRESYWDLF